MCDPVPARAAGLLRGRDLTGHCTLLLLASGGDGACNAAASGLADGACIALDMGGRRSVVPLDALEGAREVDGTAELALDSGDFIVLALAPGTAAALVARLAREVCALPELTRSLRALGAPPSVALPEHDGYFGVLLAARGRASERVACGDYRAAPARFDARTVRTTLARLLASCAAERWPHEGGERRALEVALLEAADPVLAALASLEMAEVDLARGDELAIFARWRAWTRSLGVAFACADRSWLALAPLLALVPASRGGGPSLWRRMCSFGARSGA